MTNKSRPITVDDRLRTYDPVPSQRFYATMATRPWRPPVPRRLARRTIQRWGMVVAIVVAFGASVPSVRAMVASWVGVGRAASDQVPVAVSDIRVLAADASQRAAVSARVGWRVRAPVSVPAGYQFESVVEDASADMVIITYLASRPLDMTSGLTTTTALTLIQAQQNTRMPLQVAPATVVEPVAVGTHGGAYAIGAWDSEYDAQTETMVARWRADLAVMNLFWERDGVFFLLTTDDPAVTRDDLIATAVSMP